MATTTRRLRAGADRNAGGCAASALVRSRLFKGWWGEWQVKRWLAQDLDAQHYHCLHNVTLQLADGSSTQIDHVVISPYGVFVLETKHMQGWIFGTEKQRTWTQQIYRHRSSFQNPLHQNWRHIKALEEALQLPLAQLHSVVIFTGPYTLKTTLPAQVALGRAGVALIQQYTEEVLSPAQVAQLVQTLSTRRLAATRSTHRAHVAQLQTRHAPARQKVMPSQPSVVRKISQPPPAPALAPARVWAPLDREQARPAVDTGSNITPSSALESEPCPTCGAGLVRRSLPGSDGVPRYFLRCGRFPHCRFLHTAAAEAAQR